VASTAGAFAAAFLAVLAGPVPAALFTGGLVAALDELALVVAFLAGALAGAFV